MAQPTLAELKAEARKYRTEMYAGLDTLDIERARSAAHSLRLVEKRIARFEKENKA